MQKKKKNVLYVKYLHQNKESSEEQQRGPLHPVQDDLEILDVSQNQEPQCTQDSNPTWETEEETPADTYSQKTLYAKIFSSEISHATHGDS